MGRVHRILRMTNRHPEFYSLLGPFLARREIATELGGPVWDEDNKEWFVAVGYGGELATDTTQKQKAKHLDEVVLGFAATRHESKQDVFCNNYVLPQYRGQGIFSALVEAMLLASQPASTRIVVTANPSSAKLYRAVGFVEDRVKSERFIQMHRDAVVVSAKQEQQEVSSVG